MIRSLLLIVLSVIIGLLVGSYTTYFVLHRKLVVITNWSNSVNLLGPLEHDNWLLAHSNVDPLNLKHAVLRSTFSDLQIAVCSRQLLRTPQQFDRLKQLVRKLKANDALRDKFWVSHFSKTADGVFNSNLSNVNTSFAICNVFKPAVIRNRGPSWQKLNPTK